MLGSVDDDLRLLEVGPIVHSRWLTLACRILRFYTAAEKPSKKLVLLAKFCILIYFPSWFEIKRNHRITNGAENLYNMLQRIIRFPDKSVSDIAFAVVQRNAFFAHPEQVILGMLGNDDEDIRRQAVNKVLSMRGRIPQFKLTNNNFEGGFLEQDDEQENLE